MASLGLAGSARATDFAVRPGPTSKVVFTSKAPTETFQGKTDRLEGRLTLDPGSLGDTITVHLEADLASLTTGLAKRDKHMRENHLETAKYPKAVFDGAAILSPAQARLVPGQQTRVEIEGTFALHGVRRRLKASALATYTQLPGKGRIAFDATFPISLADYEISRPQILFLKLADVQEVRVKAVAEAAP